MEREREKYQYGGEKKLEDCEATYPDLLSWALEISRQQSLWKTARSLVQWDNICPA